jgi:hypothetical protein
MDKLRTWLWLVCCLCLCLGGSPCWAHSLDDGFIQLKPTGDGWEGRWMAPRSLFLAADSDHDGHLTRDEIAKGWATCVGDKFYITDASGQHQAPILGTDDVEDGPLMVNLPISFNRLPGNGAVVMDYDLFPKESRIPQCLAMIFSEDGRTSTLLFTPEVTHREVFRADSSISRFIKLGVEHILTGWDHLLFLTCLVICGGSLLRWVKVITAFSVAHSITLALAVFGVIRVYPRIIEPSIAFSIACAAVLGWYGLRNRRGYAPGQQPDKPVKGGWQLAFSFGLIHGMGFAGALQELHLSGWEAGLPLVGFNLGVEMGQLSVAAILFPIVGYLTHRPWGVRVQRAILLLAAVIGLACCVERIFFFE